MKRDILEDNFKKMVEYEILRQLKILLDDDVKFHWTESIWSKRPKIKVETPDSKLELGIHVKDGRVYLIHGVEYRNNCNAYTAEAVNK